MTRNDKRILSMVGREWNGITLIGPANDYDTIKSNKRASRGRFKCFCGTEFNNRLSSIINGHCKSCGCHKQTYLVTHGDAKLRTDEYMTWLHMKERCRNPNAAHYDEYGGSGITVSREWRNSYTQFLADMGRKPSPEYQIDRIISEKGYMKTNCRWVTSQQNLANRFRKVGKSGYIGVEILESGKYRVKTHTDNIGIYDDPIVAAHAYDIFIIRKYGLEYAATNLRANHIEPINDLEYKHVVFFDIVKAAIKMEELNHFNSIPGLRKIVLR